MNIADKYDSFKSDYIVFIMQPPPVLGVLPAAVKIQFNTWEVFEVKQNDNIDLELWTSEMGLSGSVVKQNGLSFTFSVNANQTPKTRKKIQSLFYYAQRGCDISFTFNAYNSFIPTFPHNDLAYTPSALNTLSVNLPYAAVGLVSNNIDTTHNGISVLIGENSEIEIVVKEAVSPYVLAPCKLLSENDFEYYPFILDFDGTGYYIFAVLVELKTTGYIEKFLNYPNGTFKKTAPTVGSPSTLLFETVNGSFTQMTYADSLLSTYVNNGETYLVEIPNIQVLLKTGEICSISFSQSYTINI
jgi:hypothetical protein